MHLTNRTTSKINVPFLKEVQDFLIWYGSLRGEIESTSHREYKSLFPH